METGIDPQIAESKTRLVEQINVCLRAGDYARALDLLRGAAEEFSKDADLASLEKSAQDGIKRKSEADRLITESQELFAQQKSAEAIALLRRAYELDKRNSLARSILANALVEDAQSVVESDWLKAETLTNQALALNPAHPTAKSVLNQIVDRKTKSSVDDWVTQARKLQSSGDLFAALAWVAEGLAVHPHDAKLLQIQDAVQRDQEARRRQARRGDLDDLRRMQREIDGAADVAAKQALAARIQAVAAKHWTDGEILSIANALLLRLGLVSQDSSSASPRSKGATLILHVPRPSAAKPANADSGPVQPSEAPAETVPTNPVPESPIPKSEPAPVQLSASEALTDQPVPSKLQTEQVLPSQAQPDQTPPSDVPPKPIPTKPTAPPAKTPSATASPSRNPQRTVPQRKDPPSVVVPVKVSSTPAEAPVLPTHVTTVPADERPAAVEKGTSPAGRPRKPESSSPKTLIFVSAAAIVLVAATFFFTRRHYSQEVAKSPEATAAVAAPAVPVPAAPVSATAVSGPAASAPAQAALESSSPVASASSESVPEKSLLEDQPPAEPGRELGTLVVVAGQDDARVLLNGKLQRHLTQGGQLRVPNLELKDYVVQVSKSGFQDPPQQKISIRKGEEAKLVFNLQPQPRMASLTIQGGVPGTTVLVDQTAVGTVQSDGTLAVSTVNPGDHTIELRKDRFKPRQFKKQFVAGGAVSLAAADAALEGAPSELKITFTPADAKVALVKGTLLKMVSSGVPLSLDAGTYTLTARTADRITRSGTVEVVAGQSKTLDLTLVPSGMSKWEDPGGWKHEGDSYTRKGGDFVLFGVVPTSGTFAVSAMPVKGHLLQWVFNYTDSQNYILLQMDENNFYRSVIRNGQKTDEIIVPHKVDKKSFRTLQIRVSPTEIVHQIKQGESWTILDRWAEVGTNLGQGKFGFYIPSNDQISISSFAHYADLNIR